MAASTKAPTVSIQKKDEVPTKPLAEMTLTQARELDRQSGGAAALEPKLRSNRLPARDYTQKPTPPPDLGIADAKEKTRIIIDFNRFGQIADVTFEGQAAILATPGRLRGFIGTLTTRAKIEQLKQRNARIIASEKARLESEAKVAKKK